MSKIIGLDYGIKRVGVAITDSEKKIAFPLCTVSKKEVFVFLKNFFKEEDIESTVTGIPYNLDGSETDATNESKLFLIHLRKKFPHKNHYVVDERLTSKLAKRFVYSSNKKKIRANKEKIDKVSASIILESFLTNI